MAKHSKFITLVIFLFLRSSLFASEASPSMALSVPKETIILTFDDRSEAKWKEIERNVTRSDGLVQWIPIDQTVENF